MSYLLNARTFNFEIQLHELFFEQIIVFDLKLVIFIDHCKCSINIKTKSILIIELRNIPQKTRIFKFLLNIDFSFLRKSLNCLAK